MIFNANREPVWLWSGSPSLCPDCGAELIAKRGEIVVWHWAHKAFNRASGCYHEETEWHLAWKFAYLSLPGWQIEVPVSAGGRTYRADAMNVVTGNVREFIHSLSPQYIEKHRALKNTPGLNPLWIFDGEKFVRAVTGITRDFSGRRRLLKPRAKILHSEIGGLVHFFDLLWREWRDDVWYPCQGVSSQKLLAAFTKAREKRKATQTNASLP